MTQWCDIWTSYTQYVSVCAYAKSFITLRKFNICVCVCVWFEYNTYLYHGAVEFLKLIGQKALTVVVALIQNAGLD